MEFGDITVHFNILDAMKHLSEDLSVFRVEIIDHVVDEYMIDLYSNLHASHSSCIESKIVLDHMSEFDVGSEFELILIACLVVVVSYLSRLIL